MALRAERPDNGWLEVKAGGEPGCHDVFFHARPQVLKSVGMAADEPPRRILAIDTRENTLSIWPLATIPRVGYFLRPKYEKIHQIRVQLPGFFGIADESDVEGILEGLPRGLTHDYQYGLGLPKDYKAIVEAIESSTDCHVLVIASREMTRIDGDSFVLSAEEFEEVRAELDRIARRGWRAAGRVKDAYAYNFLAPSMGLDPVEISRGRHPHSRIISDAAAGLYVLDKTEQDTLVDAVVAESRAIVESRPEVLSRLQRDLDFVALDELVGRYERMLAQQGTSERLWQQFFGTNQFALHMAFGYPITIVQDQASMGGRGLTGRGDKVADFLVRNPTTDNAAIFEIKKPQTRLLNERAYRDGLYGPSKELAGGISQVLDQRYHFERSALLLKDSSGIHDVETYAVRCCLIIGMTPSEREQKKSFELIRRNSRDVDVVTFDELLLKLKDLRGFLRAED